MNIKVAHSQETDYRSEFLQWRQKKRLQQLYFEEYYSSRLALGRCLLAEKISLDFSVLEMANHHHLSFHPYWPASLSHTRVDDSLYLAAAVLAKDSECRSIGIDIEWEQRPISSSTLRHIHHPEDDSWPSALEIWVLKEAAYKALWPLVEKKKSLQFSRIQVKQGHFVFPAENFRGNIQLQTIKIKQKSCRVAVATIPQ